MKPLLMRWDIINYLIKKNNYNSYLEIGYYKGWSFDRIECEYKIAVDPNPCKTLEQEAAPKGSIIVGDLGKGEEFTESKVSGSIYKITSDEFFEKYGEHNKFDIVFIDGLHQADQVYRDIMNSLKILNEGGVIVLHDCNPPLYEHTTTGIDGCWTGDTYKALLKFRARFPHYIVTVDTDWGIGIISQPKEGLQSSISEVLTWETFNKNRKELLNLITPEEFLEIF